MSARDGASHISGCLRASSGLVYHEHAASTIRPPIADDRFAEDLQAELSARWAAWRLDLSKKELHEVVGALLARQVTLAEEFAQVPACWNYHVGPRFLRAMADVYITLAWIFADSAQSLERARNFIYFGLGQEKALS